MADAVDGPAPILVTIDAAAKLLSIGRTTVYQLLRSQALESVKIGGARRIVLASVLKLSTPIQPTKIGVDGY